MLRFQGRRLAGSWDCSAAELDHFHLEVKMVCNRHEAFKDLVANTVLSVYVEGEALAAFAQAANECLMRFSRRGEHAVPPNDHPLILIEHTEPCSLLTLEGSSPYGERLFRHVFSSACKMILGDTPIADEGILERGLPNMLGEAFL